MNDTAGNTSKKKKDDEEERSNIAVPLYIHKKFRKHVQCTPFSSKSADFDFKSR